MKLNDKILKNLKSLLNQFPIINEIVNKIDLANGKTFLVGGAVRDLLLDLPVKDLDIEVHGIDSDNLLNILESFGPVSLVGKVYGVFRIHGLDADWSLPRKDKAGRKPEVQIDPFMSLQEAFKRRDLTINAMGIDLKSFELVDPFNGYVDLQNKVLRAIDKDLFLEDPLRFYRVMQFIGRFNFYPDEQLDDICKNMDIKNVSVERIDQEFRKLFLKSAQPSFAINWLNKIDKLKDVLPELYATIGIKQEPEWHPEGDVYEHSLQAFDAAARLQYENDDEKVLLMYAALCHDLGKVTTTEKKDGKIISYGHELESEKLCKNMLKRITKNKDLISKACKLVRHHMSPGLLIKQNSSPSAYKRLALKLAPDVNLNLLSKLFYVDRAGRNAQKGKPLSGPIEEVEQFNKK